MVTYIFPLMAALTGALVGFLYTRRVLVTASGSLGPIVDTKPLPVARISFLGIGCRLVGAPRKSRSRLSSNVWLSLVC